MKHLTLIVALIFLYGCEYKAVFYESRLAFERDIQVDYQNLLDIFDEEKNFRNQVSTEEYSIIQKSLLVQNIHEAESDGQVQEEKLAAKLLKYLHKYNDENSKNFVRKFFITTKLKQINEIDEYMKGRFKEYKSELLKECESDFVKRDFFDLQFNSFERYIGEQLTILQKYFSTFEEVKKKDLEIVQPYYKSLVSALPQENQQLESQEELILHDYMAKMKKLFPLSEWTIKAERKLVPIIAKQKLADLIGMPLALILFTIVMLIGGYYFCLRAYLKNRHVEDVTSIVFTPRQSKFFMDTESIALNDDELTGC